MEEIEVVYKDGVFRPLKQIKLKEGTRGIVIIRLPKRISEIAKKYRIKVKEDALREFLEERR